MGWVASPITWPYFTIASPAPIARRATLWADGMSEAANTVRSPLSSASPIETFDITIPTLSVAGRATIKGAVTVTGYERLAEEETMNIE